MNFREYHTSIILKKFDFKLPLDRFLQRYFRANKAIGSKDRKVISESVYSAIRSAGQQEADAETQFPYLLLEKIIESHGITQGKEICFASNQRAPATIRVNLLKTSSREFLIERWQNLYAIQACQRSPLGISFSEHIHFANLPEFAEGLFEVQDEGSQLIAALVQSKPKQHVLDFCAGAGGKTLAFAPAMNNSGQIYLHDIRVHALSIARRRCQRAGIQNIQFGLPQKQTPSMDWVLCDVPCSGVGTLRRNPDLKWKFSLDLLNRLIEQQRQIVKEAYKYLSSSGRLVYATCSLLKEENQQQTQFFCQSLNLCIEKELQIVTGENNMDGFYGVVLKKI